MRRTTSLTAAGLLGLALLGGAPPSTAAGETCRGEAATIVGSGHRITGTEGRDVVVTNGAQDVSTLGGDDLVCITGRDQERGTERPVQLDAGPGDDLVDGTGAVGWPVDGVLGTGADRFEGGAGEDYVSAGALSADFRDHLDEEADVLLGGGGRDLLTSGQPGLPNSDVVQGGQGGDDLTYLGSVTATSVVDGGAGQDSTVLRLAAGANTVDNVRSELRHDGVPVSRWTAIEGFVLLDPATGTASTTITGSAADEWFSLSGKGPVVADLGAGDDELSVPHVLSADSRVAGGPGRDELAVGTDTHEIAWDLASGALWVGDEWSVPATGFEDAFVVATAVSLWGTDGPNDLTANSCDVRLSGRDGNDDLSLNGDYVFESFKDCSERTVMLGGRGHDTFGTRAGSDDRMVGGRGNDRFDSRGGDDRLFGGPGKDRANLGNGDDTFLGGPGRDRVDGKRGRDLCRAEQAQRCERR